MLTNFFPVIYIYFGTIPDYLKVNIEIAARHNRVIVLSDRFRSNRYNKNVTYENVSYFLEGANAFASIYVHLARDGSGGRVAHELSCFKRWFILNDFMKSNNIHRVFFGDGDASVFVNIQAIDSLRPHCDAVINVERQPSNTHWVAAGESSIWSFDAIQDFCTFVVDMYKYHTRTLMLKSGVRQSNVVDMSLLWLWWVQHHRNITAGWSTGRPWAHPQLSASAEDLADIQRRTDLAFNYSKTLKLASITRNLTICNGLDVVDRHVFDHQLAWSMGENFSLNLNGSGIPFVIGSVLRSGGIPESISTNFSQNLSLQRLYLNTIHFQGDSKKVLLYDVCRILYRTGNRLVYSKEVRRICASILTKYGSLCAEHRIIGVKVKLCI